MSDSLSLLPVDIPRMTTRNYIVVDVSSPDGPSLHEHPDFYCHTSIESLDDIVIYNTNEITINASVIDGKVEFTASGTEYYEPLSGLFEGSCTIGIESKGSPNTWAPGKAEYQVIVILNGTGKGLPSPLNTHMINITVSGSKTKLMHVNTWSPIDKSTSTARYSTKNIHHLDASESYFVRTNPNDSNSSDNDHLFIGTPNVPESLVTVAFHTDDGLSIVPIVISDKRKYTDQENCICIIPGKDGGGQAVMRPGAAKLINLESDDPDNWFNIHIGNGDVIELGNSSDSEGYSTSQNEGTGPTYDPCPYKDPSGKCTSISGCVYDYDKGIHITKSTWKLHHKGSVMATASGLTPNDSNPPCAGWDHGAVIHCEPSLMYTDDKRTSLYEEKASLDLIHFEVGPKGECQEIKERHTYYQKRSVYSKRFNRWKCPNGYGQRFRYKEVSAGVITKNSSGVYNTGFTLAPLSVSSDIAEKISSNFGVGLMCVPPSWNHLDMAIVASTPSSNEGCASVIGGSYCLPLNYGGFNNGAYLHAYNKLTRYMTPFEKKSLEGTASLSLDALQTCKSNKQILMSYYYSHEGSQDGVILNDENGLKAYRIGIPGAGSSDIESTHTSMTVDISVDASSSDTDLSSVPLNLYTSSAKEDPDASPDCLFGYMSTAESSGNVFYHLDKYDMSSTNKYKTYTVEPVECDDKSDSGSGGSSDCPDSVRIPLKAGTKIKVEITWAQTNIQYKCESSLSLALSAVLTMEYNNSNIGYFDSGPSGVSGLSVSGDWNLYDSNGLLPSPTVSGEFSRDYSYIYVYDLYVKPTKDFINGCSDISDSLDPEDASILIGPYFGSDTCAYEVKDGIPYATVPRKFPAVELIGQNIEGTCTISLVDESEGSDSDDDDDCCRYDVKDEDSNSTNNSFELKSADYNIKSRKSPGSVCMPAVYPFEGPDIIGNNFRSIMCAHSTHIVEGKSTSTESKGQISLAVEANKPNITMNLNSYDDGLLPAINENVTYICDRPIPVNANLNNKYSFSLSYDTSGSNSSSSGSDSDVWYPNGVFIAAYRTIKKSQKQSIDKGSTTIPDLKDLEPMETDLVFEATVYNFSSVYINNSWSDTPISMEDAITKEKNMGDMGIKYTVFDYSGPIPKSEQDFKLGYSYALRSIDDVLYEIPGRVNIYKAKTAPTIGGSKTCPEFRCEASAIEMLFTYASYIPDQNTVKSWALSGLPRDFYTQLDSDFGYSKDNGPWRDILTASVTDTQYDNGKYVVTRYRK